MVEGGLVRWITFSFVCVTYLRNTWHQPTSKPAEAVGGFGQCSAWKRWVLPLTTMLLVTYWQITTNNKMLQTKYTYPLWKQYSLMACFSLKKIMRSATLQEWFQNGFPNMIPWCLLGFQKCSRSQSCKASVECTKETIPSGGPSSQLTWLKGSIGLLLDTAHFQRSTQY